MSEQTPDPLLRSKWNFSAGVAVFILIVINAVAGIGFLTGKLTLQDWLNATGAINGVAIGWVTRNLSQ